MSTSRPSAPTDTPSLRFKQRFYPTAIVGCCFFILFVNQGMVATAFNVYQSYLVAEPGLGDVGGSLIITVRTLVSLITMFFVGVFYRHVSLRLGTVGAMVLTALGFIIYGWADTLPVYLVGSVFAGVGYSFGAMAAVTMLIGQWFRGHIGTAIGTAGMGSGVASIFLPTAIAAIIAAYGLNAAFFCEAGLALLLALLVALILRSRPEDVGLSPKQETDAYAQSRGRKVTIGAVTASKQDRRRMFIALILLGGVAVAGNAYFSVLLTSNGIGLGLAALFTSLLGIGLTFSKLACGWVFDLVGSLKGSVVFFLILLIGFGLCCGLGGGNQSVGFFAALFYGLGMGVIPTGSSVWALELSRPEERMQLVRSFQIAYAIGGFLFNMIPGFMAAATGSYVSAYGILAGAVVLGGALVLYTLRHHEKTLGAATPAPGTLSPERH